MSQQKTPLIIDGITFPVDLTPAQRAGLKLVAQIIIIAVFNAVLAGLAVLDNNTVINWNMVLTAAIAQGALGLTNALLKYSSAKGDLPLSMLFNVLANSVARRAPAIQYNQPEQAALAAVNSYIPPDPAPVVQPAPQISPTGINNVNATAAPIASKPQFINMSVPGTASPNLITLSMSAVDNQPSLDNVPLVNTLPNIAAVRVQP